MYGQAVSKSRVVAPPKKSRVAPGYFSFSPRSSGVVSTKLPTLSEPKTAICGRGPSGWSVKRCIGIVCCHDKEQRTKNKGSENREPSRVRCQSSVVRGYTHRTMCNLQSHGIGLRATTAWRILYHRLMRG